jgi:hypothetical protein
MEGIRICPHLLKRDRRLFKVGTTTELTYQEIAYTDSFSINASVDVSEISKLNATAKRFIRGLGSATLSASGTLIWEVRSRKT